MTAALVRVTGCATSVDTAAVTEEVVDVVGSIVVAGCVVGADMVVVVMVLLVDPVGPDESV